MEVRTRYAPSPTGFQHVGSIRTVLFEYLYARVNKGSFYLRIEDTDQARSTEGAVEDLYATLNWLGLTWDEGPDKGGPYGPYVQSERFELYNDYAKKLLEEGKAYYCYCSAQRLDDLRREQEKNKKHIGYDRKCRYLSSSDRQKAETEMQAAGQKPVIRFALPENESERVSFTDAILGNVQRKVKDINPDPVIIKSDGFPTYHFAHVIDDTLMKTSHVMRGQEWLPSAPLHVLLFRAFDWEPPVYVHMPMVMGKDGQKLSKRHGDTAVRDFKAAGYLPEAFINYLALVGWAYDDSREFFTLTELEEMFSLDKLSKSPGIFDYRKLQWFNGQYIRQLDSSRLRELILPYLQEAELVSSPPAAIQEEVIESMLPVVQPRLKLLSDIVELTRFLFTEIQLKDPELLVPKNADLKQTAQWLARGRELVAAMGDKDTETLEAEFAQAAADLSTKPGNIMMPLRIAITGSSSSPPLFDSIQLLGLEKALKRIDQALNATR